MGVLGRRNPVFAKAGQAVLIGDLTLPPVPPDSPAFAHVNRKRRCRFAKLGEKVTMTTPHGRGTTDRAVDTMTWLCSVGSCFSNVLVATLNEPTARLQAQTTGAIDGSDRKAVLSSVEQASPSASRSKQIPISIQAQTSRIWRTSVRCRRAAARLASSRCRYSQTCRMKGRHALSRIG